MATDLASSLKNPFLTEWKNTLCKEDVEIILCINPEMDTIVSVDKTKSKIGNTQWDLEKLQNLIESKNESWQLLENDQLLLLWQYDFSILSSPDAIMSFAFEVVERTRAGRPSSICLNTNLFWVAPENRQQGLGYHLAAHFIDYLQACNVNYPLVSKQGIYIDCYSELYSIGGERLSRKIYECLEVMRDEKFPRSIKSVGFTGEI